MIRRTFLVTLVALCLAAPATANDSVASMGTGGLILQRTDGIVMRSEDLFVSAREIRVRYRFFNRTNRDIATIVAFPLPDIVGGSESDVAMPDPGALTFVTTVGGRRVRTSVEQKVILGEADHTGLLRDLGLPLSPYASGVREAIAALPRQQIDRLAAMNLIEDRGYTDGADRVVDYVPLWTLKTTHYWTQVFQAGRTLNVDHRYSPAIGGSAGSLFGDPDAAGSDFAVEHATLYCADAAFQAGAARLLRQGQSLTETWIDYVLTTGANWAEPIREFRLVVDKGSSHNLVSFCGENVRRISPTQFEMRRTNFTPTRDLSVVIVSGVQLE
jgi:hypothetical protein